MFEIQKNVPIPAATRVGRSKYPFKDMEIGDSISVEDSEEFQRIRRSAYAYSRSHEGVSFASRAGHWNGQKVGHGGTLWRVE